MRMLMNNLDPEVAENPDELIVYGGSGKAARSWADFDRIVAALKQLENDETLLVQSGRAVGIVKTHSDAPRVLISNSMLVPHWATWDEFRRLEAMGLTMFGQMTAGSWIYIGTQGIVQGTYETFGAAAREHFGGSLKGRLVVTGGLGGMGGAQPLAATMHEGVCLCVEVDQARIDRRLRTKYLDKWTDDLDDCHANPLHFIARNENQISLDCLRYKPQVVLVDPEFASRNGVIQLLCTLLLVPAAGWRELLCEVGADAAIRLGGVTRHWEQLRQTLADKPHKFVAL